MCSLCNCCATFWMIKSHQPHLPKLCVHDSRLRCWHNMDDGYKRLCPAHGKDSTNSSARPLNQTKRPIKYMKYIASVAILAGLLGLTTSVPLTYQKYPGVEPRIPGLLEERQLYGFGMPSHFAQSVAPEERPNSCGTSGCTPTLGIKVREFTVDKERVKRALRKRVLYGGEFITNVVFNS